MAAFRRRHHCAPAIAAASGGRALPRDLSRPSHGRHGRSLSTAIFFLLARGERSHWHRIDAVEIWHYYAGAALSLQIADERGRRTMALGPDLASGEAPQAIVPAGARQSAESIGDWTLAGCTVSPGFDFATFELAPKGWEPTNRS